MIKSRETNAVAIAPIANSSDLICYSVSHNGRFLFRTEKRMGFDWPDTWETVLMQKFPAAEGYKVERERHPSTFTCVTLQG